ncbi:MAG: hypothetical protein CMJ18_16490 [Phycisphaeraceae bacterium]|nr:hypothetical protein [Phycisphaeraceae bacterium]
MKMVFALILLVMIALGVVYFANTASFDPTATGQAAKDAIRTGMSWQEVIAATQAPSKFSVNILYNDGGIEVVNQGQLQKFDEQQLSQGLESGAIELGFVFEYRYSEKVSFAVDFDEQGNVAEVRDLMTMTKLLGD